MNRGFGAVRNLNNRLEDHGYFMASGSDLVAQLETASNELAKLSSDLTSARNNLKVALDWQYGKGNLCKPTYTAKKCTDKRDAYEVEKIVPYKNRISELENQVKAKQSEVNALKSQIEANNEAQQTLADQGLTPEAILQQATIKAQTDAEIEERKSKSIKFIVISVAVVVVLLGGFYFYRKIKRS